MSEQVAGQTFNVVADNPVIPGCTISKQLLDDGKVAVTTFSLADQTSISPESYDNPKLIIVESGQLSVSVDGQKVKVKADNSILTPAHASIGVFTDADSVYTEINLAKGSTVSPLIRSGHPFCLSRLVPYQDGRIVNCDLIVNSQFKFVLMAFDKGTGLAEHSAPGKAIIFDLAGKGTVDYKRVPHHLRPGDALKMDANARHRVVADEKYKMALLVMTPQGGK